MPLFLLFNIQTMHIKSKTQQHCYVIPKNLIPWRDSNQVRCLGGRCDVHCATAGF
jgi:hypothetical protein